ncbi:MAG: polyamine aminopropyltransferase [Thermoplasmata archaeon]|nr:polyamine aminopropyltransferase [Staphylococcus epidermidis]
MKTWYGEFQTKDVRLQVKAIKLLFSGKSKYQKIELVENATYGKVLFLDGTFQLTERDEFIYHEMLAHIPLFSLESPKEILIIGGGDGGLARECLKHKVENVHLVEIDEMVVEVSKKYLPTLSNSFNDKRLNLVIDDGSNFVKNTNMKFDVVLIDSTDPVGPASTLFTEEFYRNVKNILKPGGILGSQTGTPFLYPEHLKIAYNNMKKVFKYVSVYLATIPTYPSSLWSFTFASDNEIKRKRDSEFKTKYYNAKIHDNNLLPEFVKEIIQ